MTTRIKIYFRSTTSRGTAEPLKVHSITAFWNWICDVNKNCAYRCVSRHRWWLPWQWIWAGQPTWFGWVSEIYAPARWTILNLKQWRYKFTLKSQRRVSWGCWIKSRQNREWSLKLLKYNCPESGLADDCTIDRKV